MKRVLASFLLATTLIAMSAPAFAMTQPDARIAWEQAQKARLDANVVYTFAQDQYKKQPTPSNEQKVVDAAKAVLNDALDEVQAWLNWKKLEADENLKIPPDLRTTIDADVATNLGKIEGFRADVAGITSRLQAAAVFLKMVAGYQQLVSDVARDSGALWVAIGTQLSSKASEYEAALHAQAQRTNNTLALSKLEIAMAEITNANTSLATAKAAYLLVKLPGTPIIKFAEGNADLRTARMHLEGAVSQLELAREALLTNN